MNSKNKCKKISSFNAMIFLAYAALFVFPVIFIHVLGCGNPSSSTVSEDMVVIPRDPPYPGCYPVIGTRQAKCYDSYGNIIIPLVGQQFYGQDAQFTHTAPVYTKSSDGLTVKDEVTGLTWQQSHDGGKYYWSESQTVIDDLNRQSYGGYNDWRLPTIKELYSIWNGSTGWPYIDTNYFNITYSSEEDLSHAIFWSSDKYSGAMGNTGNSPGAKIAFGVNFGTGHIKAYSISVGPRHLVRCVRGNLSYAVNMFQNNNDSTISDLATDLMWSQFDNGSGIDWEHALAYVQLKNTENYLGHNDWRLPNTKELQSLVDYTRSPTAINPANVGPAIDKMFSCTGILNEGGKPDYPYYWSSTSAPSNMDDAYPFAWYAAFGRAEDGNGEDLHGAGAVRFDKKILGGGGAGEERVLNFVRMVRNIK